MRNRRGKRFAKRIVETATKAPGRLDILVNNAVAERMKTEEFSSEESDKLQTNVYDAFISAKAPPVMEKGGAINNTASIQAYQPIRCCSHISFDEGRDCQFCLCLSCVAIDRNPSTPSRPVRFDAVDLDAAEK